jgi:hypothetical protein
MLLKRWDSDLGTTFSMTSNTALRKRKRKEQPRLDRSEPTKGVLDFVIAWSRAGSARAWGYNATESGPLI